MTGHLQVKRQNALCANAYESLERFNEADFFPAGRQKFDTVLNFRDDDRAQEAVGSFVPKPGGYRRMRTTFHRLG